MLNGRKAEREKTSWQRFAVLEFILLYVLASLLFFNSQSYVNIVLFVCGVVLSLLSGVFCMIFQGQAGKRKSGKKPLEKISHISYRFLCTRNRRDAFLASTISVGAIMICFVLNIVFNFSGILRDAYRDNMGFSTVVLKMNSLDEGRRMEKILDENSYFYTKAYLKLLLENENCDVETASQLSDGLVELLSDYLSVVAVSGAMLIMVTGIFFYSMVRSDLLARKKEMYLYQMYGASRKQAFWVVYLEYLMIAWISSFSVVLVTMALGEMIFSGMLHRHYPLSVPVVLITSLVSTLFVLMCCLIAQWMNFVGTKMEVIRDE
ncbi:MAG: ABC transporter permease [Roseburia sp.]|nr:ABC transporter permease [Roseburia sp.]